MRTPNVMFVLILSVVCVSLWKCQWHGFTIKPSSMDTTVMLIRHTARRAIAMQIMFPFVRPRWAGQTLQVVHAAGSKCLLGFTQRRSLGVGMFGQTYATRHPTVPDGDAVLKVVLLNRPDTGRLGGIAMFEAEVAAALVASRIGFGPHLHRSWRCGDKGFMLMERCIPIKAKPTADDIMEVVTGVYQFAKFGLIHNDLHMGNIMQHEVSGKPVIIDYGMATTIGASSGYEQVMRYKAQYSLDTPSATTLLTLNELYDELQQRKPTMAAMLSLVADARRRAKGTRDKSPVMNDVASLVPSSTVYS